MLTLKVSEDLSRASVFGVDDDEGDYDGVVDDNDDEVSEKLLDAVKVEVPR